MPSYCPGIQNLMHTTLWKVPTIDILCPCYMFCSKKQLVLENVFINIIFFGNFLVRKLHPLVHPIHGLTICNILHFSYDMAHDVCLMIVV